MSEFSYLQFTYWFKPVVGKVHVWEVVGASSPTTVCIDPNGVVLIQDEGQLFPQDFDLVASDFDKFKTRPEFYLGQPYRGDEMEPALFYQTLFTGVFLANVMRGFKQSFTESRLKYESNAAVIEQRLHSMLDWLKKTDFYEAPASTQYHDSCKGGLVKHSLSVYNKMLDLMKTSIFENVSIISATLAALTHDWCKTNYYEPYMKNVKDESTGQWHQELAYKVNQKGVPLGHGVASLFLVSKFFNLSAEEGLAIRWHMGRWHCSDLEVSELQKANETCPLVYLIQFADQLACVKY